MGTAVLTTASEALDGLDAALDRLTEAGVEPDGALDAVDLVRGLEAVGRRVVALQLQVADRIERRGLHRVDGHASVKVFLRHNARLSDVEAGRRCQAVRCLRDLPAVREAVASGRVGMCQLGVIARAHANKRVRAQLCDQDQNLAVLAAHLGFEAFQRKVLEWVRVNDEEGTCDANQANHEKRTASMVQNEIDLSWELRGQFGALQGARIRAVYDHFIATERALDWEQARAIHGDQACEADLARNDDKRRADAMAHIYELAAAGHAAETGQQLTTDLVIDQTTFERELTRLAGGHPLSRPLDLSLDSASGRYRCHTEQGFPVEATEAVAAALVGQLRRVVLDARSVAIDLGRRVRLFTGAAQVAATIAHTHCYWPGCHVRVDHCQIDHLQPWSSGGRTSPGNGAPACGRHNRYKEAGFTARRDEQGRIHTYRPDGTEIT